MRAPFLGNRLFPAIGMALVIGGAVVLLDSFARFAWQGLGTRRLFQLAIWLSADPTVA